MTEYFVHQLLYVIFGSYSQIVSGSRSTLLASLPQDQKLQMEQRRNCNTVHIQVAKISLNKFCGYSKIFPCVTLQYTLTVYGKMLNK